MIGTRYIGANEIRLYTLTQSNQIFFYYPKNSIKEIPSFPCCLLTVALFV